MEEIWRDIEGYEGRYQVSNLGNVRSLNYNHRGIVKNLRQAEMSGGYLLVELSTGGKGKTFLVHRLVASAFIPNPDNHPEVNHKDENKRHNNANNLEWCTRAYNATYGTGCARHGKLISKPVEQLKDGMVVERWSSQAETARRGYSPKKVSECCNGRQKTHKGYEWRKAT